MMHTTTTAADLDLDLQHAARNFHVGVVGLKAAENLAAENLAAENLTVENLSLHESASVAPCCGSAVDDAYYNDGCRSGSGSRSGGKRKAKKF